MPPPSHYGPPPPPTTRIVLSSNHNMAPPVGYHPPIAINNTRRPYVNMLNRIHECPTEGGEKNGIQRSQLLDEFRNSRIPQLQVV